MRSQLSEPCGSELRRRWSICAPDPAMALIYGLDFYARRRRQDGDLQPKPVIGSTAISPSLNLANEVGSVG